MKTLLIPFFHINFSPQTSAHHSTSFNRINQQTTISANMGKANETHWLGKIVISIWLYPMASWNKYRIFHEQLVRKSDTRIDHGQ